MDLDIFLEISYGMDLEWEEMKKLIEEIEDVFKQTKKEIEGFCCFLSQLP